MTRVVLLIALAGLVGCMDKAPPAGDTTATKKTYSRDEFKKLVIGKTEKEVLELVGKPDKTSEAGQTKYWHYHDRTIDPITGKADSITQLVFDNGAVSSVNH